MRIPTPSSLIIILFLVGSLLVSDLLADRSFEHEIQHQERRQRKEQRRQDRRDRRLLRKGIIPPSMLPPQTPSVIMTVPMEEEDPNFASFGREGVQDGEFTPLGFRNPNFNPNAPVNPPSFGLDNVPVIESCPSNSICVQMGTCNVGSTPLNSCSYLGSMEGVCCSRSSPNQGNLRTGPSRTLPAMIDVRVDNQPLLPAHMIVTPLDVKKALDAAKSFITQQRVTENSLTNRNLFAAPQSEEGMHSVFFGNDPISRQMNSIGQLAQRVAAFLAQLFKNSPSKEVTQRLLDSVSFPNSVTSDCPRAVVCPQVQSKYRSADGSCNNLDQTHWGQSHTPFTRLLPPDYGDGFDAPRKNSVAGSELPSARQLSFSLFPSNASANSQFISYFGMLWGQFVDHDITGTATTRSEDGQAIRCCGPEFDNDPSLMHPACFPIKIPDFDPFYSRVGRNCISFVRSGVAPRINCALGPREQLNQLSSFIDGGMVYGKTKEESNRLRLFQGGRLTSSTVDGVEFLPKQNGNSGCTIPQNKRREQSCFRSGDGRVNVHANLVALHALFLRHHNNLARQLVQLNPGWNDETTFQETRRIVIAQIQHITVNEFLPMVLGEEAMDQSKLKPTQEGFTDSYDPAVNPQIFSSFATAAFRMHTLIPKAISFSDGATPKGRMDLSETFLNPSVIYEKNAFSHMLQGMSNNPAGEYDHFFTDQISNHLFRPFGSSHGIDLVALNIQRGRDHGLPPYNRWREVCGLNAITSWEELSQFVRPGLAQQIKSMYMSIDDIDLFVGGTAESPREGSLVGPTFACLLTEQFRRIKRGDRFWYENEQQVGSFSLNQLNEIKKTTLARIICDAGPSSIQMVQLFTMVTPNDDWNKRVSCDSPQIPKVDLTKWANEV